MHGPASAASAPETRPARSNARWLLCTVFAACLAQGCAAQARNSECDLAVQVLGSGGPIADDGRASSSYVLWDRGRSVALIDAGSGAFLRFG
ncbi:MAG: hypothetical protein AAGD86_09690, partial [Pseudomonadota bacterium]